MISMFSTGGRPVYLKPLTQFYAFDPLYWQEVLNMSNKNDVSIPVIDTFRNALPYAPDALVATFKTSSSPVFLIEGIKKAKEEEWNMEMCFACDSGSCVVVASDYIHDIGEYFNYDRLVDAAYNTDVKGVWKRIEENFKDKFAWIVAPGINTHFEFEGSGIYKIM
jgi:hypothetical protein